MTALITKFSTSYSNVIDESKNTRELITNFRRLSVVFILIFRNFI